MYVSTIYWESCMFQQFTESHVCFEDPLSHFRGMQIFAFWQEEIGAKSDVLTKGVILFLLWCAFLMPSLKNSAQIFLEVFLIQYLSVLVKQFMTSPLSSLHNTKTSISLKGKKIIQKGKRHSFFILKGPGTTEFTVWLAEIDIYRDLDFPI